MKNFNEIVIRPAVFCLCLMLVTGVAAQNKNSKSSKSKAPASKPAENKADKTETPASTKAESKPLEGNTDLLKNHGMEIQKVIKTDYGVIRGYEFGTTKQKIRETEDAEYVADGRDFIIYNVKINEKENAEIIYYLDENDKVKGFGIAFLVSASVLAADLEATLVDDFQRYFNERYGKFTVNAKNDEVWVSKDGAYTVEMGDSSEDATMLEIEIEIFKK